MLRSAHTFIASYLVLLLAARLPCSAQYTPCKVNHMLQLEQEIDLLNAPYKEDFEHDSKCCNASSWVVGKENGTLGVYFQLPRRGRKVKNLILEKNISGSWKTYTQVKLGPEDYWNTSHESSFKTACPVYSSAEFGYHIFQYISSGQYRLRSCAERKIEREITTEFDESTLNCIPLHSTYCEKLSGNGTCSVRSTYEQNLTRNMDKIFILKDCNGTIICKWSLKAQKGSNVNLMCEANDNRVMFDESSAAVRHGLSFKIDNLLPGSYSLSIQSYGQLAFDSTKIGVCAKAYIVSFNVTAPSRAEEVSITPRSEYIVMPIVTVMAAIVALCSLSYIIYVIRNREGLIPVVLGPDDAKENDLTRKKVLLLYARDCFEFTVLMATFRDLLKSNNFEVYDCYDPAHKRQVDKNPTQWMRNRLNDSSVRVIVVSSRCAQIQYANGGRLTYQKPHYLDHLFNYGLCGVLNIHKNIYQRIFSVRFEGFTGQNDVLSTWSWSRKYSLPDDIYELLRDLRYNVKTPEKTVELKSQVVALEEKLGILIEYKNAEPNYLYSTILT